MAESTGGGLSWSKRAAAFIARKAASYSGYSFSLTDPLAAQAFGRPTYSGKSVTETSALQVSTMWACNRILAEAMGQFPRHVFEVQKDGSLKKVDHDLADVLIHAPNADMTGPEYTEARMLNQGLQGNAYSRIERSGDGKRINTLYPIKGGDCYPERRIDGRYVSASTYSGGELVYKVNDRGRWEHVPADRIWHNRIFSLDGVNGLSPIGFARESLGFAAALEEFGSRVFGQGLHAGTILEYPTWMPDDKRALMQAKIEQQYQGLINTGKPFIAEGGLKVSSGIIPPKDIEFLGLRGYGVDDICRFYLVPSHRVNRLEKATNNNIEQLSLEFVMYTLLPYIVKDERSVDRWLFNARDRGRFVMRYNYDGLLRADSEGRSKLESVWLQNGVLSRNEVRALENMPKSDAEGMNDFTVQSNMIGTAALDALAAAIESRSAGKGTRAEPKADTAPVQIQLKSFDDALEQSGFALQGVSEGLNTMAAHVGELARTNDALLTANVTIVQQITETSKQLAATRAAIEKALADVGAERELVLNDDGDPVGSRIKPH